MFDYERNNNNRKKIKERLGLHNNQLSYESHESTAVKSGSSAKALFTL
jgi:hypothetical protein